MSEQPRSSSRFESVTPPLRGGWGGTGAPRCRYVQPVSDLVAVSPTNKIARRPRQGSWLCLTVRIPRMRKQPRTRSRLVTPSASGAGSARASDRRSRDSWGSLSLPKVDCSFRFYGCAPRENSDSVYVACPGGRTHIDEIQVSPDGVQLTPIQGPPLR